MAWVRLRRNKPDESRAAERSNAFSYDQIGKHRELRNTGLDIPTAVHGFDGHIAQGLHVGLPPQLTIHQTEQAVGEIRNHADPAKSGIPVAFLNRFAHLVGEEQIWEVHASGLAERVKAPGTRV